MERRETQADSHVIIICLMMCGGEQGESAIEIRAREIQKNRFHFFFCGALKDAASFFCGNGVYKKKKKNTIPCSSINSGDILHPRCL